MNSINLAERMEHLQASDIREILKVTGQPDMISFAGGLPAPELFPVDELRRIADEVLRLEGERALQYSTSEGDPELRELVARRMNHKLGTRSRADEILVTCGSQQALDLVGKLLLDKDDVVLCESPTYLAAIQAFKAYQARFVEVATDDDGMLPKDLERRLADNPRVKMIYVVPDFQNPSGRCWSMERRLQLLQLARRFNVPVVEDSPYAELRFAGEPVPPVAALDREGRVIYLGTCSKIMCPGMRIGWAVAAPPLIQKLTLAKQGVDLHTSSFSQRLLAVYLRDDDAEERITHICDTYRHRRNVMVGSLEAEMPREVTFTRPEGGLFLWATLPDQLNARELLSRSLEQHVAFVPGGSFFPNGGHENTMRLNFSNMPPERIVEGVTRLAAVVRHKLERATSSPGGRPNGLNGEQPFQATVDRRQAGCAKEASAHE